MTWILLATLVASGDLRVEPALSDSITIARLQYEGGGDWYANPSSLPNLLAAIQQRTGIPVARREVNVRPLDPALYDHPYLYMTGHGDVRFSVAERAERDRCGSARMIASYFVSRSNGEAANSSAPNAKF